MSLARRLLLVHRKPLSKVFIVRSNYVLCCNFKVVPDVQDGTCARK